MNNKKASLGISTDDWDQIRDQYINLEHSHEILLTIAKAYRNLLRTMDQTESFTFVERMIAKAEGR